MPSSSDLTGVLSYYTQDPATVEWGFPAKFIDYMHHTGLHLVDRVFEWSAGPMMAGMLTVPIVRSGAARTGLIAVTSNEPEGRMQHILEQLNLQDRIDVIVSDVATDLPEGEVWDAAVFVPPHFNDGDTESSFHDPHWFAHRSFLDACSRHLAPNGKVIMLENILSCSPTIFYEMAEGYGLKMEGTTVEQAGREGFYFIVYVRNQES